MLSSYKDPIKLSLEYDDISCESPVLFIGGKLYEFGWRCYREITEAYLKKSVSEFLYEKFKYGELDRPPMDRDIEELIRAIKILKYREPEQVPTWIESSGDGNQLRL